MSPLGPHTVAVWTVQMRPSPNKMSQNRHQRTTHCSDNKQSKLSFTNVTVHWRWSEDLHKFSDQAHPCSFEHRDSDNEDRTWLEAPPWQVMPKLNWGPLYCVIRRVAKLSCAVFLSCVSTTASSVTQNCSIHFAPADVCPHLRQSCLNVNIVC